MAQVLRVDAGETHTTVSGATETYARGEIQGQLVVEGHTIFTGEEPSDVSAATEIDLPMALDFRDMDVGTSIFLGFILGIPLAAALLLRNPAALVLWALGAILLIISGLFDLGLELFWLTVILGFVALLIGAAVRWGQ